jgi:hypothetical protein
MLSCMGDTGQEYRSRLLKLETDLYFCEKLFSTLKPRFDCIIILQLISVYYSAS